MPCLQLVLFFLLSFNKVLKEERSRRLTTSQILLRGARGNSATGAERRGEGGVEGGKQGRRGGYLLPW